MVRLKSCPRCGEGDMALDSDRFGSRLRCIQCGHSSDLQRSAQDHRPGRTVARLSGLQLMSDRTRWDDESWVSSVFPLVANGVEEGHVHVPSVNRSRVVRAYQVAAEFNRRRLTTLAEQTAEQIAARVRYSTEPSYVKLLFGLWTRWKKGNRHRRIDVAQP